MRVAWIGVLLLASGCVTGFERVALPWPPDATAPLEEREQALVDWSPAGRAAQAQVVVAPTGVAMADVSTAYLQLNNGVRVGDPRDLLPLVPGDSVTATSALEFGRHFEPGKVTSNIGMVSLVAGLVLGTMVLATLAQSQGTFEHNLMTIGAGGTLIVAGVAFLWSLAEFGQARRARESAFMTYSNDLRRRLGFPHAKKYSPETPGSAETPKPRPPPRCIASQKPEWKTATAIEKRNMLRECAPPAE